MHHDHPPFNDDHHNVLRAVKPVLLQLKLQMSEAEKEEEEEAKSRQVKD